MEFFIIEFMKKILFLCDKNEFTSFGRVTMNLIKAVAGQFEIHVLWLKTPKYFPNDDKSKEGIASGVTRDMYTSHEIWASSLYTGFFSFRSPMKKKICEIVPDIIVFIRPELGFLIPPARSACRKVNPKARTVMFLHDVFAETLYPTSPKFILLNLFYIRNCVCADSFLYNSEWTRNASIEHFGKRLAEAPGAVVGLPIDSDLFAPPAQKKTPEEREAFRRKLGIRNFQAMCLNVSLDEPRKNIETYFEMARLRPDVAFVRVGKLSERLKKIINEKKLYNVFHFPRFNALELNNFYHHTDLVVYPSHLEGFGLPPMEAISSGTPSICAATTSLKENLEGVIPLVENSSDAEGFAKVLDRVLAGENIVNGAAAEKMLDKFSMKSFSRRVCEFMNSL